MADDPNTRCAFVDRFGKEVRTSTAAYGEIKFLREQLAERLQCVMRPYGIYDTAVSKSSALQQDEFVRWGQKTRAILAKIGGDA